VFSSNLKTQKQLMNGIKRILGLIQPHMEPALNGGKLMTAAISAIHDGSAPFKGETKCKWMITRIVPEAIAERRIVNF
jgi:hypothetical protein